MDVNQVLLGTLSPGTLCILHRYNAAAHSANDMQTHRPEMPQSNNSPKPQRPTLYVYCAWR